MELTGLAEGTAYTVHIRSLNANGVSQLHNIGSKDHSAKRNKLVGTAGQTHGTLGLDQDRAQGFLTGGNTSGYKLTSVDLDLTVANPGGTQPTYTVSIYSSSGGFPSTTKLGTLTNPSSLYTGLNTFTAPGGIDLAANTNYYVVVRVSADGTANPRVRVTHSDSQDGQAGWRVGNTHSYKSRTSNSWTHHQAASLQIVNYGDDKYGRTRGPHLPGQSGWLAGGRFPVQRGAGRRVRLDGPWGTRLLRRPVLETAWKPMNSSPFHHTRGTEDFR